MGMGGGGAQGSGAVNYPPYMQAFHMTMLGGLMPVNIATAVANKYGKSPFTTLTPYDPSTEIVDMEASIMDMRTVIDAFKGELAWPDMLVLAVQYVDQYIYDHTKTDAVISAYNDQVNADLENVTLPRLKRGMQDINAVNSSAFIVAQALVEAEATRNKSDFAAKLYLQDWKERGAQIMAGVDAMVKLVLAKLESWRSLVQLSLEENRLSMIAHKEEMDQHIHITELDSKWDLELFGYAGNALASIGAASVRTGQQSSPLLSALGGGIAGIGAAFSIAAMM